MTLPPWKPAQGVDRDRYAKTFTRWIHAELDRDDEAQARQGDNPFTRRFILNRARMLNLARENGDTLSFAEPKRKVGAPKKAVDDYTDFDWAARDVPRIRALFVKHWGKRNRNAAPLAEQIAAERWELSSADAGRLIVKFQRKA